MSPTPSARLALAGVPLLLLAGCASDPGPAASAPAPAVPAAWRTAPPPAPGAAAETPPWVVVLGDPELEGLIAEALRHNTDLRIAAERVEVLRAQYRLQQADRLPGVAASGEFARGGSPGPAGRVTSDSWTALLAVPAWEIDLWGRVRDLSRAAEARFLAAEENRRAVRLSLIAEVSNGYFGLLSLDQQVEIARATLASRMQSRTLVEQRNLAGLASGLDRRLADSLVANAEQALAELVRQRMRQENALAVLVGRPPGEVRRTPRALRTEFPALAPVDLPSVLLARRPDVLAAERQLRAAELDVAVARKLFLPSLSLTGFAGFVSPQFADLMEDRSRTWGVEPAASLPLFDGGRRRASLAISEAQRRIAVETYAGTVRGALREVEDALADYQSYVVQRAALARAVVVAQQRLGLTLERYSVGASPYLDVLDSFRELFSAAVAQAQADRAGYASVVQVYRAMGGGWEPAAWAGAGPGAAAAEAAR
jgi:NodT family efflux transporter outer membrane factor (OMF) lipoprotein